MLGNPANFQYNPGLSWKSWPRLSGSAGNKEHESGYSQAARSEKVKERIQVFEGVVISKKGRASSATFTVRRVSFGTGVERIFPLHSPTISSIEVTGKGNVRRARLYYLRELRGKAARIKRASRVQEQAAVASTDAKA